MASSSTSFVQKSFKYDVFLSFRGEDTRKTFVDHLYHALERKSIITYKDDEKIEKGNRISDELMRSIEDSKFYIIVFSKNYASSSWCLDELVKIMECQRMTEHTAYPVFYDVEPTEIRKQSGSVGKAFTNHEKEEDPRKWKDALKEAASLAGWELKNTANGHEAKFIQEIVEEISLKLLCINLSVDRNLVGMEGRVKDVVSSLETGIDDVRMIGIKGMGGAGKTTLARTVFDQLSNWFEGSSFVENVREVSNGSSDGLKSLQKQILSDVLNDEGIRVSGVYDGKNKMKKMLSGRKVLVILDDVDHIDQLKALAGEPSWFKQGSRIIITTREEQVLVAHRVNFIREKAICIIRDVNLLSHEEAICLFSRNAFWTETPIQGYEELSEEVVRYAAGLPLTVTVLGSFLCDRSILEWNDALERLKTIPLEETLQKLELSYNGLANDFKEIFLDVACILKGWGKDKAIRALKSCGFHAEIGLTVLEQKSLLTISYDGYLGMHDHIEEMGKNIVRRLHPNEPHKHSRLWINKEIEIILANNMGTKETRCIHLENWELHPATVIKGLRQMKGLRFLHVEDYLGLDDPNSYVYSQYISDDLRYMHWYGYPFTCLPKKFQANDVVPLQMLNSNIAQLSEGGERKVLDKVAYIDLSRSKLRTFDLGPIPNLETLILKDCHNLVKLYMHGETPKLKFLDLSNSDHLKIIHLDRSPNLETLILNDCRNLEELHMPVGSAKLKYLNLFYHSKLRTLDLGHTMNIENLSIYGCEDLVELQMPGELKFFCLEDSRLRTLDLAQVRNLEEIIIEDCTDLVELIMPVECLELRSLKIYGSNLRTLDLTTTSNLEMLHVYNCVDLVQLHMPVQNLKLKCLNLYDSRLRILDLTRTPSLETLYFDQIDPLVEFHVQAICHLRCLRELTLDGSFPKVPNDLHQLESLEKLSLSSKMIKHLPNSICRLKHLKVLRLNNCHLLEQLPEDLGKLERLETLSVTECIFLLDIPNSICEMKHLENLKLTYCFLVEKLPEELGLLKCLKELDIEGAGITHLPYSIFQLRGLCIHGSTWRLESYGFRWIIPSLISRYSAKCFIT